MGNFENSMQLSRTTRNKKGDKRKSHRFSFTDQEIKDIRSCANFYGYQKARDFFADLTQGGGTIDENTGKMFSAKINVMLTPMKSALNQIYAGINVERNKQIILQEVEKLCRDFR